jgi:glycosyltransferase involved in cell wall biosynthesis
MKASFTARSGSGRRRVLHFVSTFESKTDTKWLLRLLPRINQREFDFSIACFYSGGGTTRQQFEALGFATFDLEVPQEFDPRAILRARNLIEETQCDLVHTHLLRADLFAGAAARWAAVPIVSTVYAMGEFRRAAKRRSDRLLDAACAALPNHVIAVCEAVRDDLVRRVNMKASDISVVHTGIDAPPAVASVQIDALRKSWSISDGDSLVLTLSRLSYEKGIDTLIEAAARLKSTHPRTRIVVVGDGPDRDALRQQIDSAGLRETVRLAGFSADVWPALAAADIVCIPSKSEGMPNVLLEAMVMNKPVVATRVGGIPEAIEHESSGLIVDAQRPDQLANALARLIDDRQLADRLASRGKQIAATRFSVETVARKYEDVYRAMTGGRSPRLEAGILTH